MSFIDPLQLQDTNNLYYLLTYRKRDQKVSDTSSMEITNTTQFKCNDYIGKGILYFLCYYKSILKNLQVAKLDKTKWLVSAHPVISKPVSISMLSKIGSSLKRSLQKKLTNIKRGTCKLVIIKLYYLIEVTNINFVLCCDYSFNKLT